MDINFIPLCESHLSLLLKWLNAPHVKAWWDPHTSWTPQSISEKYSSYIKGYKLVNGLPKPIHAYLITIENSPVGYIQVYSAYDFPRDHPLKRLPSSLGAFDIFIGEKKSLGKGIGSQAIIQLFQEIPFDFDYIFADPDRHNLAAIKAYEKAGLRLAQEQGDIGVVLMLKTLR